MILLFRYENIQTLENLIKKIKKLVNYQHLVFGTIIVLSLIEILDKTKNFNRPYFKSEIA
jgi:hypothetical protein